MVKSVLWRKLWGFRFHAGQFILAVFFKIRTSPKKVEIIKSLLAFEPFFNPFVIVKFLWTFPATEEPSFFELAQKTDNVISGNLVEKIWHNSGILRRNVGNSLV